MLSAFVVQCVGLNVVFACAPMLNFICVVLHGCSAVLLVQSALVCVCVFKWVI